MVQISVGLKVLGFRVVEILVGLKVLGFLGFTI